MKATYGNTKVVAWKISRSPSDLDWVQENFANGNFFFVKDIPELFRAPTGHVNYGLGGGIYGKIGEILIRNEQGIFTIINEKKFRKHYKNIEE